MLIVLASPDAVLSEGKLDPKVGDVLRQAKAAGNPVALVSNHAQPKWFADAFDGSGVQFIQVVGRQNGEFVKTNADKFSLHPFDVLVLATKDEDVQMGKNGGALLVAASWSNAKQVKALGIQVADATELQKIIAISASWSGHWYFASDAAPYRVRALSDLSTKKYGMTAPQQAFAQGLTSTVKNGGAKLNGLLAITSRSLLMEGFGSLKDLVWGVYPSSSSANADTEVLSDFTHRLRTTVSRVRHAKLGEPLFIRHKPSAKRSSGGGGDRSDPTEQIMTIHLNPFYGESGRLAGKHVVVVDDCTTYGVSFGVAAAFLRAAGAASVTGLALGKFGSQLRAYDIEIKSSPFAPVLSGGFSLGQTVAMAGKVNAAAQQGLQDLLL